VISRRNFAVSLLEEKMAAGLVSRTGSEIAYALKGAREPGQVAGVRGRIVRVGDRVQATGESVFGAAGEAAGIVLTAMRFDPMMRSVAIVRCSPEVLSAMEEMFLEICSFDREKEPAGIQTMDWGVASCCRDGVPEVIYDLGAVGKEAMARFMGQEPIEIANKIIMLSARIVQD
jgi:hydroxymethylpyrimidine/phosphomethylpyrimidine kinase